MEPASRRYAHVLRAVEERPWALHPPVLAFIVDLVHFRSAGGRLSAEEIDRRLAVAKEENGERSGAHMAGAVAIVPVYGLLAKRLSLMSEMSGGTSYDELQGTIAALVNDPDVASIVLDIDSPGGEVDGLPEFASFLRAARDRKPIVAQVNSLAASAAYWIASQANEIAVTPSGEVGSIGVYTAHQDVSGAMEQQGVRTTLVSAGRYKVEGNPYEPLGDEARVAIQDHVDEFYAMFLDDVAKGRGTTAEAVATGYGEGRTLLAKAARAAGMVDRIDTLGATVDRVQPRKQAQAPRRAEVIPLKPAAAAAPTQPDRTWNARVAKLTRSHR
jgi:signal peptide peptidase SppA